MATKININGKLIARPGVYSTIKSGIKNPPVTLPYGNLCIVDTGLGTGWGGGSGINGEHESGLASVYEFNTIQDFRAFVKGGPMWQLAEPLFRPAGLNSNVQGIAKLFYVRAATTTKSSATITITGGDIVLFTRDEGTGANGTLSSSGNLVKGYGYKITESVINPGKFIFSFYVGSYVGSDPMTSLPYNRISEEEAKPTPIISSPEVGTIEEIITWCNTNSYFNELFGIDMTASTGTGNIVVGDVTAGYVAFAGGTETYGATDYTAVLNSIADLDNNFFLSTEYGDDAASANNFALLDHILNSAKYDKFMIVAGGFDETEFSGTATSSCDVAVGYNSDRVIVTHGGALKTNRGSNGFYNVTQLYKAAAICGRICGLEPQTPITMKTIGIDGEIHKLSDNQMEFAIDSGVLYTNYDIELGSFVTGLGINTLQNNDFLVNEDATSYNIAVKRITAQLNKEIIYTAKRKFFGGNVGPNRNTISEGDLVAFTEGFLDQKTASSLQDNLIISYGNIVVTLDQDVYYISFEFVPNTEISKLVFTGIIIE